jgi:hypothetical protein
MLLYAFAGFALIVIASFIQKGVNRFQYFCVGASMPLFLVFGLPLGGVTGLLRPATLDMALRNTDLWLGLDGLALTRWMAHEGFSWIVPVVYCALPLMMAVAWILEHTRTLLRALATVAFLVIPFYLLVPAAGPHYAFADFPMASHHAIAVAWVYPRNCFPSGHFTWALLLAWNVHDWRWRWVFVVYAALMAIATVASGEHYFVDLMAAVPFAVLVQAIAQRKGNHALRNEVRKASIARHFGTDRPGALAHI